MDSKMNEILCAHSKLFFRGIVLIIILSSIYSLPLPRFSQDRFSFILIASLFFIKIISETRILSFSKIPDYISIPGVLIFTGIYYNLIFYSVFNFNPLLTFSIEDYSVSILRFLAIEFIILVILAISLNVYNNKFYIVILSIFSYLLTHFFNYSAIVLLYVYLSLIIASSLSILESLNFLRLETIIKKIISFHFLFLILYPYSYAEILKNNSIYYLKNKFDIKFINQRLIFLDKAGANIIYLDKKNNSILIKKS